MEFIIAMMGIGLAALFIISLFVMEYIKVKNGYPIDDGNGGIVLPHDATRNVQLLEENEALRNQLDQVYDRIETLERIVTDKPSRLAEEIDRLAELPPRPDPSRAALERLAQKEND